MSATIRSRSSLTPPSQLLRRLPTFCRRKTGTHLHRHRRSRMPRFCPRLLRAKLLRWPLYRTPSWKGSTTTHPSPRSWIAGGMTATSISTPLACGKSSTRKEIIPKACGRTPRATPTFTVDSSCRRRHISKASFQGRHPFRSVLHCRPTLFTSTTTNKPPARPTTSTRVD